MNKNRGIFLKNWASKVFLLQIEQPNPGIKLHTSCPMQESAAEAWTKIDYGQYFLLYISLMFLFSAVV